jgi:hypothetical protein
MIELPELPNESVEAIPGGIAQMFRVVPIEGNFERIVFLCAEPLTKVQEENLQFMMGRTRVEFADPAQYPDIHRVIDALIGYYYPSEKTPMLVSA